jgi:putative transposase
MNDNQDYHYSPHIEVFYNRQRHHGHLGGLAPMMFEAANSKASA